MAGDAGPTERQSAERDANELEGLLRGISLDGRIVAQEAKSLERWCDRREGGDGTLFREARARVREAVADGVLDAEEREDILHYCERIRGPSAFYSIATADMQRLHGILGGIGSDGAVILDELEGLRAWLNAAEHLRGTWPYDEVHDLVVKVLGDGRIDEEEHRFLVTFTREFLESTAKLVLSVPFDEQLIRRPLCANQPEIEFAHKNFCVTGSSPRASRRYIECTIAELGGKAHPGVIYGLDYLIVAAERTHSWAFSCYGRKVEAAMALRRAGAQLEIVHESDFWVAAAGRGARPPAVIPFAT